MTTDRTPRITLEQALPFVVALERGLQAQTTGARSPRPNLPPCPACSGPVDDVVLLRDDFSSEIQVYSIRLAPCHRITITGDLTWRIRSQARQIIKDEEAYL